MTLCCVCHNWNPFGIVVLEQLLYIYCPTVFLMHIFNLLSYVGINSVFIMRTLQLKAFKAETWFYRAKKWKTVKQNVKRIWWLVLCVIVCCHRSGLMYGGIIQSNWYFHQKCIGLQSLFHPKMVEVEDAAGNLFIVRLTFISWVLLSPLPRNKIIILETSRVSVSKCKPMVVLSILDKPLLESAWPFFSLPLCNTSKSCCVWFQIELFRFLMGNI